MTTRTNPDWDQVDEASDESFPASDPPAWGSSHAFATSETAAYPEGVPRAVAFYAKRIALGLAAVGLALSLTGALRSVRRYRREARR